MSRERLAIAFLLGVLFARCSPEPVAHAHDSADMVQALRDIARAIESKDCK